MLVGEPGKERYNGHQGLCCGITGIEVTDQANELTVSLVATCGIPGNRPSDASGTALPYAATRIDQEVVGDVVPAFLGTGMEVVEATQDRRCVRGRMPVS